MSKKHLEAAKKNVERAVAEMEHVAKYPEHQKLSEVHNDSQKIGAFLEWLESKGYTLCTLTKYDDFMPIHKRIEEILGEYFEIDLDKIEDEKVAMLEECREKNGG